MECADPRRKRYLDFMLFKINVENKNLALFSYVTIVFEIREICFKLDFNKYLHNVLDKR